MPTTVLLALSALWVACAPDSSGAPGPSSDDSATGVDDSSVPVVDDDSDGWEVTDDCDDHDAAVNPAADEVCNGIDDDCDGSIDANAVDGITRFADDDGDGYGGASFVTCDETSGLATDGDCDDANAEVRPGACEEPINGRDDDCDGVGDLEIPIVQMATDVNGDFDEFQAAETGPVALRIIGTVVNNPYDTRPVHFLATKPTILVLWSRNDVKWIVDEAVPGTLQKVIVTSPHGDASAVVPKGVPTDLYLGANQLFADNPMYWADPETRDIETVLKDLTGIEVTSWAFAYGFEEITIADGKAWPEVAFEYPSRACAADETPFAEPDTTIFPKACDPLLTKGHTVCLTTGGDATVLFDLDGNSCEVLPTGIESDRSYLSLGWRGDFLYAVVGDYGQVVRLRLTDGHVDRSYRYGDGMSDLDEEILVYSQYYGTLSSFESWAVIVGPADAPFLDHVSASLLATWDGFLWTSWFSGDSIEKYTLSFPSAHLATIPLESYDTYIDGFDLTDDDHVVVRGPMVSITGVHVFDALGNEETMFDLPVDTAGVSCFTLP